MKKTIKEKSKNIYSKLAAFVLPLFLFAVLANAQTGLANPLNQDSLTELLLAIVDNVIIPIGTMVVVIFIIYSGFLFVTASGNEEKIKKAKAGFFWVIVGSAVLLGAKVIGEIVQATVESLQ